MKQKFTISSRACHILAAGLLFPAAFCLTYVWGIVGGRIETAFDYDKLRLMAETAKIYLTCAAVALFGACVCQRASADRP